MGLNSSSQSSETHTTTNRFSVVPSPEHTSSAAATSHDDTSKDRRPTASRIPKIRPATPLASKFTRVAAPSFAFFGVQRSTPTCKQPVMPSAAENVTQSPMDGSPSMGSMSKKTIAGKIRQFSPKKARPSSIYLPPIRKQSLQPPPSVAPTARIAVELSKFPPTFTKRDIHILFQGYRIEDDVAVGNIPQFLYPLRATVFFQSVDEAARAVSSMDGMLVRGKPIELRVVDSQGEQAKEMEIKRQTEELKSEIIRKARTNHPDYMNAVLEVRELEKGNTNYAFLQSRTLIQPMDSPRTKSTHAYLSRNIVKWDLVAAGAADLDVDALREDKEYDVRIEALKNLLFEVEDWAALVGVWKGWEGSWMLDSRCSRIGR